MQPKDPQDGIEWHFGIQSLTFLLESTLQTYSPKCRINCLSFAKVMETQNTLLRGSSPESRLHLIKKQTNCRTLTIKKFISHGQHDISELNVYS